MRVFFIALGLMLWGLVASAFEIEEDRWFRSAAETGALHILSSTDTAVFAPLIEAYQARNPGVSVHYVVTNTQALFHAIADEQADFDLAISSAMDLQMKLANDGLALSHQSPATARLPAWAHWRDQLFGFTQEPVVMALSRRALGAAPIPETRQDLIRLMRDHPDLFAGRIGTYDPARSGAGYLFASQDARQSDTFWRMSEVMGGLSPHLYASTGAMLDDLQAGKLILAYNVLGSYLADRLKTWPDGEMVELRDYTQVLLRTAFVPVTAQRPDLGRGFLDFLISHAGQTLIDERTGFSRIDEAALAEGPHLRPIRLDPGLLIYVDPLIKAGFLDEWAAAVLRR
ncbi:ABC transporter substrate-binding protein [Tropicibacter oceani]|uniref:ABC transporter substrate-binding protein n=1 Tax=Tropicibacter oceani TaxID=3058420 RepID=A0ABY8QG78_9RHOB|nr:ABC transporter substrate-binding protein [Tropicibacter oceani]WGW03600.1 ABC transporter substrate-binding protein [Tropicibacter oceani]